MKSLRILFSVLFVMSFVVVACDDDKKTTTQKEICDNGIDDDKDGKIDCFDTDDCATHAHCQQTNNTNNLNNINNTNNTNNNTNVCTIDDIFFDSPQVCQVGYICGPNPEEQYLPQCLPEAYFAGGSNYGPCGAEGQCPKGAGCFDMDGGTCLPYCTQTHQTCPTGGACIYRVDGVEGLFLCGPTDDCNVFDGTGCEGTDVCMLAGEGGLCTTDGTVATGGSCATEQCLAGNVCAGK